MSAAFFDTNILGYAADTHCPDISKRDTARRLLRERVVSLSTQVLMEFYNYLRRKLHFPHDLADKAVRTMSGEIVIVLALTDVLAALALADQHQISHWDGLILRAAEKAGADVLYTEDLNHGQTYGSVRVCNPFIEDFLS